MKEHGAAVLDTWGTEFPEAVAPRADEMVFTNRCVNPVLNTGLMTWLARLGVTHLAFGGVVTNLVLKATARAADDAGFGVTVLKGLRAAPNPEWHRFVVENMLPLYGAVSTSAAWEASLVAACA